MRSGEASVARLVAGAVFIKAGGIGRTAVLARYECHLGVLAGPCACLCNGVVPVGCKTGVDWRVYRVEVLTAARNRSSRVPLSRVGLYTRMPHPGWI